MARKPKPVEDQLRDFEAESASLPPPPKNLGNFPDELDSRSVAAPLPLRAESPEELSPAAEPPPPSEPSADPEAPAAPASGAEPEPEEPTDQAGAGADDELSRLRRENEFLRLYQEREAARPAAAAPAQPPDVTQLVGQYLGGYRVRAEDVQTILADPEKGAEYLTAGIYAAVAAGAAMALDRARAEFQQYREQETSATQLRDLFYRDHADLAPYGRLVQQFAGDVYGEAQRAGRRVTAPELVRETSQRVRAQLREWGVAPTRAAAGAPAASRRILPARGEMAGSGRANGRTTLSPLEKQLREFEAGTSQYR